LEQIQKSKLLNSRDLLGAKLIDWLNMFLLFCLY